VPLLVWDETATTGRAVSALRAGRRALPPEWTPRVDGAAAALLLADVQAAVAAAQAAVR